MFFLKPLSPSTDPGSTEDPLGTFAPDLARRRLQRTGSGALAEEGEHPVEGEAEDEAPTELGVVEVFRKWEMSEPIFAGTGGGRPTNQRLGAQAQGSSKLDCHAFAEFR